MFKHQQQQNTNNQLPASNYWRRYIMLAEVFFQGSLLFF